MPKIILSLILAVPVFSFADERMPQNSRRGCQGRMVNSRVDDSEKEARRMLFESYEYDNQRVQADWDGSFSDGSDARDPEGF